MLTLDKKDFKPLTKNKSIPGKGTNNNFFILRCLLLLTTLICNDFPTQKNTNVNYIADVQDQVSKKIGN